MINGMYLVDLEDVSIRFSQLMQLDYIDILTVAGSRYPLCIESRHDNVLVKLKVDMNQMVFERRLRSDLGTNKVHTSLVVFESAEELRKANA